MSTSSGAVAGFDSPNSYCDIVMKGGVTSGVVYPLTVAALAKSFSFKNVGGTSAGAIAAAATAAAEYRRRNGHTDGFQKLERLPEWLGAKGNLLSLFRPDPETASLHRVLLASLGSTNAIGKLFRVLGTAARCHPFAVLIGAAPGVAVAAMGIWYLWSGALLLPLVCLVCGIVLAMIGVLLALGWCVLHDVRKLPDNLYGLSRGIAPVPKGETTPTLMDWLSDYLDDLAGRKDGPLTFGDLWSAPDPLWPSIMGRPHRKGERSINLEIVTTCLNHGRPYKAPWSLRSFYFSPEKFRLIFPGRIVDAMERAVAGIDAVQAEDGEHVLPFPDARDLPIIVAVRMSLSFPLLISAVPLYARDYGIPRKWLKAQQREKPPLERCWFSDGGIASNFPVHFFDRMLPLWPTFAINLRPPQKGREPDVTTREEDKIYLPANNSDGILEWWLRFKESGLSGVLGFLNSIQSSMQNWRDNMQLRVPGYRDRIAHVILEDHEGGMNLNMDPKVIQGLGKRGAAAGDTLRVRYTSPCSADNELCWDNHRWVRFRSTMELLTDCIDELATGILHKGKDPRSIIDLIGRASDEYPKSYRWNGDEAREAAGLAMELIELRRRWMHKHPFRKNTPRPTPDWEVRPRM